MHLLTLDVSSVIGIIGNNNNHIVLNEQSLSVKPLKHFLYFTIVSISRNNGSHNI